MRPFGAASAFQTAMPHGKLIAVATPIGNLGDLSPRAIEALRQADFWLVEDTRVSGKLCSVLDVKKPMFVLNEHTAGSKIDAYVSDLLSGRTGALLTDAGSPSISDPGAMLVDKCHQALVEVDAIPGPSAPITALTLSGFFAQRFAFLGYLPRKDGAMRDELSHFAASTMTLVLFESPYRVGKLAQASFAALGPRRIAFCRELTKLHQQVVRTTLPDLPDENRMPRKGEFTVVIEGLRRLGRGENS